jgi:phosphoglycolate phosphatase
MTISLVLFDLDGTLVDSLDDLTNSVNHVLADFGRQQLNSAQVRQLVGKGVRNLVQLALITDSAEEIDRGVALFTQFNALHIADKSRLYPGVPELLQELADKGIRMAVISNKQEALSRLILKELAIGGFFDRITGGDTFPEMKPSPLPLKMALTELGCRPSEAVMVGDSINDIEAGNQAGVATIGCTWGYGNRDELSAAGFLADSCSDIINRLRTLE